MSHMERRVTLGPWSFTEEINIVPYFFEYKTEFNSFLNSPKNLDLWDCLGRVGLNSYFTKIS